MDAPAVVGSPPTTITPTTSAPPHDDDDDELYDDDANDVSPLISRKLSVVRRRLSRSLVGSPRGDNGKSKNTELLEKDHPTQPEPNELLLAPSAC